MSIISVSNKATTTTTILPPNSTPAEVNAPAAEATTTTVNISAMDASIVHNGREARNLAEKQRRDKLNASIHELSTMVPHVAESTRRLDKTAVLRFAAHGFRLQHVFGKSAITRRKSLDAEKLHPQLTEVLMQLLDSFLITLTCHGQIVLISETVEQLLGHCRLDLYGQNILNIIHPEDQAYIQQQLIPCDLETMFIHKFTNKVEQLDTAEDSSVQSVSEDEGVGVESWQYKRCKTRPRRFKDIDRRLRKDRRSFTVRVARAGTRAENTRHYEVIKFDGCFRRSDHSASENDNTFPIVAQLIRRSRSNNNAASCGVVGSGSNATSVNYLQHDAIAQAALHGVSGNDIVFVGVGRVIRPPKLNTYPLNSKILQYRSRHLIDGRIVDCDQRIGLVAGYMTDEVINLSPFSFMHQDDVRWVIVALRQMYDCNSNYGESYYRLLTRNGNFIYMHTKGYMEIDKQTNKVHSFVCINTLLDEEGGKRSIQKMKDKFSVIIQTKIPSNSAQNVPASQNPQQLERIVLYLIENLQKRNENMNNANNEHEQDCSTQRTTMALVPPETASVRNAISRSVSVVQQQYTAKSPSSSSHFGGSEASLSPISCSTEHTDDLMCRQTPQQSSILLARLHSPVKLTSPATLASHTPTNIHDTLTHSWQSIDQSLSSIEEKTQNLREQQNLHSINSQLDALIEEHDMQQEILVHIKDEYDAHLQQNPLLKSKQQQQQQQLTKGDKEGKKVVTVKRLNNKTKIQKPS